MPKGGVWEGFGVSKLTAPPAPDRRGPANVRPRPRRAVTLRLALAGLLALAALAAPRAAAQELDCEVTINRAALTGNEFGFLDDLREEVRRYFNERAWTDDVWDLRERIDCQVRITLTDAPTLTSFTGSIVVQASRPIYGTGQRTNTMLIGDDRWTFSYTRGQSLIYDPNRFDAFLSVLDYYANVLLGYDYDTFSELGGTPYFEQARRIADLGRGNANALGWGGEPGDDRSRVVLVQELLDPAFAPLRRAHFAYHYDVLDAFVVEHEASWERALAVLQSLNELYQQFGRRRFATDVFWDAKYQELTALFRDAPQRNNAYALLSEMDPKHISTYDALVN